jgi:hypothetical protein
MPGGYKLWVVVEGEALAIYTRSGHVAAGHVPLPISLLYYLYNIYTLSKMVNSFIMYKYNDFKKEGSLNVYKNSVIKYFK